MANLSIREAVKHFDVSRPTLSKALKDGKVSGVQDRQGQWQIDPAELARVYKARSTPVAIEVDRPANDTRSNGDELPNVDHDIDGQVKALRESLAEAERRARESEQRAIAAEAEKQEALAEKRVAEALAEERKRILDETLQLIPPPAPATAPEEPKRRRWWLFGGS